MPLRACLGAAVLLAVLCGNTAAAAERRIALVVGNNAYKDSPLTAPIDDANAMAEALADVGFKVVKQQDLGRVAMLRAIRGFVDQLGGDDTVGVLYFAGHGMQSHGKNFLIPIDADVEQEDDIELQGVDIQYVLDKFATIRGGMNILILDACRTNPFAKRGVKRASGLAAVDGPPGTLVAFAAAPGQVSLQRAGEHGVYTKNVLLALRIPGIPVEEVFKRVRSNVVKETGALQVPWENTSLVRDFYFKGAARGAAQRPQVPDAEADAWAAVSASRNIYDFTGFLRHFPDTRFKAQLLEK